MKTAIITLVGLLLLTAPADAQFGVRVKTPPGRSLIPVNDKGIPIVPSVRLIAFIGSSGQDGVRGSAESQSTNEVLIVIDDGTQQPVGTFDFQTNLGVDDIQLLGFAQFKADQSIQAIIATPPDSIDNTVDFWIVNFMDKAVEFSIQGVQPQIVANIDGAGGPEIVVYIPDERVVSVIGFDARGSSSSIAKSDTFTTSKPRAVASDYQLVKKFESQRQRRLAFDRNFFRTVEHLDLELDGVTDVVMLVENSNGDPVGMEVRDGSTFDVKWEYTYPQENIQDILVDFHGLADVNGDGETEVLVGNNLAVTQDGTLNVIDENIEIRVIFDVDDDGVLDLIVENTADSTVQVWGKATATSVSEEDLIISGFQLQQNYPNPFNPSTTITYSVERGGQIELKIYDLLGRAVRSLVSENKPKGEFSVVWDGKDDLGHQVASGHYFYQLNAGEFQSVKRMILLK